MNSCKSLRNLSFGFGNNRFIHKEESSNYRMSNIQAALGLSQLRRIDDVVKRKIEIGKRYYKNLKDVKGIFIQPPALNNISNVYWVVGIIFKKIRSKIIAKKLLQKNIQTRPFFYPMNKQPILKKYIQSKEKFPNSDYISNVGRYLPSGIAIKNNQIDYICKVLKSILKN